MTLAAPAEIDDSFAEYLSAEPVSRAFGDLGATAARLSIASQPAGPTPNQIAEIDAAVARLRIASAQVVRNIAKGRLLVERSASFGAGAEQVHLIVARYEKGLKEQLDKVVRILRDRERSLRRDRNPFAATFTKMLAVANEVADEQISALREVRRRASQIGSGNDVGLTEMQRKLDVYRKAIEYVIGRPYTVQHSHRIVDDEYLLKLLVPVPRSIFDDGDARAEMLCRVQNLVEAVDPSFAGFLAIEFYRDDGSS